MIAFAFFNACKSKSPKIDKIEVDFELIPFYEDLHTVNPDSFALKLDSFKTAYGSYFDAYSMGVIGAGNPTDEDFVKNMQFFLAYEPNQEVLDTIRKVLSNYDTFYNDLKKAFKYFRYYFPEEEIPDVYMHISGFNQNMVVDSSWISVSLEQYLGADCIFYEWLAVPVYLRKQKATEKLVPDIMKALAMSQFQYNDSIDDLVNQMIYQGKILWFVKQTIPSIPDSLLFDYSKDEIKWVQDYEKNMWETIVEQKHLFSTDRMIVQRYIEASPFTSFFGSDSPGRTGIFLGYRIIQSFIKRNPDITLEELMQMNDGHEIFAEARYRP